MENTIDKLLSLRSEIDIVSDKLKNLIVNGSELALLEEYYMLTLATKCDINYILEEIEIDNNIFINLQNLN